MTPQCRVSKATKVDFVHLNVEYKFQNRSQERIRKQSVKKKLAAKKETNQSLFSHAASSIITGPTSKPKAAGVKPKTEDVPILAADISYVSPLKPSPLALYDSDAGDSRVCPQSLFKLNQQNYELIVNDRAFSNMRISPPPKRKPRIQTDQEITQTSIGGWKRASPNKTLNDDLLAIDLNTKDDFAKDIITSKVDQIIQVSHTDAFFPLNM